MKSQIWEDLLDALKVYSIKEFNRPWSVVLQDKVLHSSIRCSVVDGGDTTYNKSVLPDQVISLTLTEILSSDKHCPTCALSFIPSGFNYNFFTKVYQPYITLFKSSKADFPGTLYSLPFTQNFTSNDLFNIYLANIDLFSLGSLHTDLYVFPRSLSLNIYDPSSYIYIREDFILTPVNNISFPKTYQPKSFGSITTPRYQVDNLKELTLFLAQDLPKSLDLSRLKQPFTLSYL